MAGGNIGLCDHRFEVWAFDYGPYPLLACLCGVKSMGAYLSYIWYIMGI